MLVEVDGCIFDESQLKHSHGFKTLDPIDQETFVNHIHLDGKERKRNADTAVQSWIQEMKENWPGRVFRIYRHHKRTEITIRFHMCRQGEANWSEGNKNLEVITVET